MASLRSDNPPTCGYSVPDHAPSAPQVRPTHIGGQAVIEGVMMRGKKNWAVAVRDPRGEIQVEQYPLASAAEKNAWMRWPVVRGVVGLVESVALGGKALTRSAEISGFDEEEGEEVPAGAMAGAMAAGVVLAIVIFIILPAAVTNLLVGSATENPLLWNSVDGVMRVVAFFLYVWLIGFMPDLRRVFMHHGAEHKVIHAYEHGDELTVENARRYSEMHIRCGTSFLLMVMVLSIVVFSLVPVKAIASSMGVEGGFLLFLIVVLSRIVLLPVVAGLAYEVTVKWAGPRADKWYVKVLTWPGIQMQRMTTRPPTDDMIEVAIASVQAVLAAEQESALAPSRAPSPETKPEPTSESTLEPVTS